MWMKLLEAAVNASSMTVVATELDVSRTTISLVLAGKYGAKTDRVAARVLEVYGRVMCPFLAIEISHETCRKHASSSVPTSSPRAMRHWKACQTCAVGANVAQGEIECS